MSLVNNKTITTTEFFSIIKKADKSNFIKRCEYLFKEFGTSNRCNRFDIGNCIELFLSDLFTVNNLLNDPKPNQSRIDIDVFIYKELSIKFSSSGNIKLHNSLGKNRDINMVETIIITPINIYLVSKDLLNEYNININDFLKNTTDGLLLNRKLLKELKNKKYKYICNLKINMYKKECKNRMCSELLYECVKKKIPHMKINIKEDDQHLNKMELNIKEDDQHLNKMELNIKEDNQHLKNKTFVDICAGIGGFHSALAKNGWKCVMACDIDKHCRKTYEKNYGIKPLTDIKKIDPRDIPDFMLLTAGFPCQTFSHSGKQEGFKDKIKGTIFFYICNILEIKKPNYFILENVKNLYGHNKGKTWETIYQSLTKIGYKTYEKPIIGSPLHVGVPQNRDRVFIIGVRNDLTDRLPPFPVYKKDKTTTIYDILEDDINIEQDILQKVKLNYKQISVLNLWETFIQYFKELRIKLPSFPIWTLEWDKKSDISSLPQWKQKYIKKNRLFYLEHKKFLKGWLKKSRENIHFKGSVTKLEWQCGDFQPNDSIWSLLFQYRPSGIRISRSNYSPALVAMTHIVYIGKRKRKLTPREAARLQSFPESFALDDNMNQCYKQFGNSVNVKVIEKILKLLLSTKLVDNKTNKIKIKNSLSPWNIYCKHNKQRVLNDNNIEKYIDAMKILSQEWKNMSKEDKKVYILLADEDKKIYEREISLVS